MTDANGAGASALPKTTSTKARNGGMAGTLVPGLVMFAIQQIEANFMIDIPPDVETFLIMAVTGAVTSIIVWAFPNKPKEAPSV